MEAYLATPWAARRDDEDWWIPLVGSNVLSSDFAPVVSYRRALLSLKTAKDMWTLRLIAGNHPLVFFDSLDLLLGRSGGVCTRRDLDDDVFLLGMSEDAMALVPDYEAVLDQLECSSIWFEKIAGRGSEYLQQAVSRAVSFFIYLLCLAEGKQQRQVLRGAVLRTVALLCKWLQHSSGLAHAVRQALLHEFDASAERVSGMFDRTAYYYRDSGKADWLAKNWNQDAAPAPAPVASAPIQDLRALTYAKAVLHPARWVTAELEPVLIQAWTTNADRSPDLVSLSLLFVYENPRAFRSQLVNLLLAAHRGDNARIAPLRECLQGLSLCKD